MTLYICNSCGEKITDPVYSYETSDKKVVTDRMEEFSRTAYVYSATSKVSCNHCGSNDLKDPDKFYEETAQLALKNGDL